MHVGRPLHSSEPSASLTQSHRTSASLHGGFSAGSDCGAHPATRAISTRNRTCPPLTAFIRASPPAPGTASVRSFGSVDTCGVVQGVSSGHRRCLVSRARTSCASSVAHHRSLDAASDRRALRTSLVTGSPRSLLPLPPREHGRARSERTRRLIHERQPKLFRLRLPHFSGPPVGQSARASTRPSDKVAVNETVSAHVDRLHAALSHVCAWLPDLHTLPGIGTRLQS